MTGGQRLHYRPFRQWHWVPTAVLLLGVASTVMLYWIYSLGERQRTAFEHVDALMDIQIRTANFHLLFEEAHAEGRWEELNGISAHLDAAITLGDAILHGGLTEHGTALTPLRSRHFREHAEAIVPILARLRDISAARQLAPETSGPGSDLDEEFDAAYESFQQRARTLELAVETEQMSDHGKTRRLILAVVAVWAAVIAGSIAGLYGRERRRKQAELALGEACAVMEQRVEDRTAELAAANVQLREEVAERKRTEFSLRESETQLRHLSEQFHTLLDAIPDSIALISSDLRVLWANNSAASAARHDEISGRHCHRLRHGAAVPCEDCAAARSFRTGTAESSQTSTPDGRIWELRAFPMRNETGRVEHVIEIAEDITAKVALQAESLRVAHLASIGELAAGVAHEINNPINGIINCAQILLDEDGGDSREVLGRILREGDRVATIVSSLLSFAAGEREVKVPVRVHDILQEALALTAAQLRRDGIVLDVNVPEDLPAIIAHPQQIQQVFLNVINNARYALNQKHPTGGAGKILGILAAAMTQEDSPRLRITFHDHGTGIPADKISKVVTPFYTTKPQGVGTGLGLSISHGIVSDHGGKLSIQSVEGQFTKVNIVLPATTAAVPGEPGTAGRSARTAMEAG